MRAIFVMIRYRALISTLYSDNRRSGVATNLCAVGDDPHL